MDFSRRGESLWAEWSGNGYIPVSQGTIIFCTETHVDLKNEVVLRALASAIQRDGIADSLGDAFKAIQDWTVHHGYAGDVDEDADATVCDEAGETFYGDIVDSVTPITWVEVSTRV